MLELSNNYFFIEHIFLLSHRIIENIEWNIFYIKHILKMVIEFCYQRAAIGKFTPYSALTLYKKSEKSLEPFSSNMETTRLLGPFWAKRPLKYHISAHFGKTGFFPEKRPCTFLALIVVNFHAEYEENPWSGFWEKS